MPAPGGTFDTDRFDGGEVDWRAAGLVALLGGTLALPFLAGISMLDEGALVHIADRIASGEVLYRDVATGVMPGSYYLQALLFLVFGRSLLVGRVFMILLFAAASSSVFFISRRVSSRTVALAAAVSFLAISVSYWRFPGYSAEAIFLTLWTLAAALAFIESRRRKWLVVTGLGLGATLLFKQNYGTFVSLGVATGVAAAAPDWKRAIRDVATTALVAATPIALVAALFAYAGAGADFWASTVGIPLRVPNVFTRPWPPLFGEPDPRILRDIIYYLPFEELALDAQALFFEHRWLGLAIVRLAYYLPLAFLVTAGVVWGRRRDRLQSSPGSTSSGATSSGALLLGTSAFLFLGVFPRVDAHHLFMALAPCFPLAAWLLGPKPRPWARRCAVGVSGIFLAVSLLSRVASIHAAHPEEIRDAFVDRPRGRIWVERWQAEHIGKQLDQIEERVPKGQPIFVAPSSPMYYFLADRPNPTRYPLILPGALDEDEVVRTLSAAPVRYALLSDIAFEHFPFQYVAPTVWSYAARHFVPAEGAGWDVAPFAPYLYERAGDTTSSEAGPSDAIVVEEIVGTPLSPPPEIQTVSLDEWHNEDPYRVQWQSTYLEPSLLVRGPGGWRKVLVSWEVPAGPGYRFDFACAVAPWAWAGWVEGQGTLVEVWVSSAGATSPPRRVFMKWLNPRAVAADRRWHRDTVDLSSFASTQKAIVTLVVGPAPTFIEADATVAWSGLRLVAPANVDVLPPRNVGLEESAARHLLAFQQEDLSIFQEAARDYPDLGAAHVALAEVAASLGRHDLALSASEKAVRVDPEPAHSWMRLGQELQRAGRLADAVDAMEVALTREPTNANYHAALAAVRLNAHDLERARTGALAALRHDPENVWAWTLLAKAEEQLGSFAAALEAAERSAELSPSAAWPQLTLAAILIALDRDDEALLALERAARLDLDSGARAELARNLLACGQPERARDEASVAIAEDPDSLGGRIVLGHAEIALGQWDAAVQAWRGVVRLDPDNASARVQLARSLARVDRVEEAREVLVAARARSKNDPARLREVAIVLEELGSSSEARSLWRYVLTLAPDGALKDEARRRLATSAR